MVRIFKTSVSNRKLVKKVKPHLDQILSDSIWNFDLKDSDRILRIKGSDKDSETVINLFNSLGMMCEELN